MGRDHPNFYKFLASLQKEQANTERILLQLDLGNPVKKGKTPGQRKREEKILNIVQKYDQFREEGTESRYLELLGHYVHAF